MQNVQYQANEMLLQDLKKAEAVVIRLENKLTNKEEPAYQAAVAHMVALRKRFWA